MIAETFSVLLITTDPQKNHLIQNLLSQSDVFLWNIDWVNNFTTALMANNYKSYNACILECEIDQIMTWVDHFDTIPVIFITEKYQDGMKALDIGVTDYWLSHKIDCSLIENSLRLAITNSRIKNNLLQCRAYYDAFHYQHIEQKRTEPEILLNTIFENIPNGLLIVDQKGIIRFANLTATKIFNQSLQNLIGYNFGIPVVIENSAQLELLQPNNQIKTVEIYVGNTQWDGESAFVVMMIDITEKKQAELLLKETEEKFSYLTNNIQEVFFIYSGDNQKAEYVSPGYEKIFQESCESLYNDPHRWLNKVHPEDRHLILEKIDEVMETYNSYHQEYRMIRNDGEIRWISLTTVFVKNEEGKVEKIVGIGDDITQTKTIENKLRENNIKLQLITDNIPASLAYIDQEEKYQFVNPHYAELFKKKPEEIIGKTVNDILGTKNYALIKEIIEKTLIGEDFDFEQEFTDFDIPKYFRIQYVPYIEDEKVLGFFAFIVDITQRKQAEKALKESEKRYRSLYERTPAMLHFIDPSGYLINVSNKWLETLGYSKEEVKGKKSLDFLVSKDREYAQTVGLPNLKEQGYNHNLPYQFIKKNGELVDVLLSAVTEKDTEGNLLGFLAVLEDITERNKLEKQIQEYQENLEKLVIERTRSLQESEAKNKALLKAIPDLMFRMDRDGNYIDFHAQNIEALYIDPSQFLGKNFRELMPPELVKLISSAQEKAFAKGTVETFEYSLPVKGKICYYESRITTSGENEILSIVRDITEQKIAQQEREKAEQELQKSENLYRLILSSISDAIFLTDAQGNLTFICDNVHHIFGYTFTEVETMENINNLIDESKIKIDLLNFQEEITNFETEIKDKFNQIHTILINIKPLEIEQGKLLITCHDITDRKQTEIALKESETRFRELVEHIEESFWVNPPDPTQVTYISPGYEKIWGRSCESLMENGDSWIESVHPEDRQRQIEALTRMAQGEDFREEYRIVRPNGEIRWVFGRAFKIYDDHGNLIRHVGIAEDITQRKKMEERLLLAQKIAKLGNWDWNIVTNDLSWSDEIYQIFGIGKEDFNPTYPNFLSCIHPEDQQIVIDAVNQALETRTPYSVDHRVILPNGEMKIVHEQGDIVFNPENEPVYMIGTVQDITDRKKVEQAFRDSEISLEEAQKVAHIGSWEYNLKTQELKWSKELYYLYDLNPSQPPPTFERHLKRVHPEDRIKSQSIFEKLINEGIPYQFDYRILLPNGTIRYAEARGKPIFDQNGNLIKVFGTALDISQRKQTEFALRESEERFRVIFEQAGIGMSICNLGGQFLQVNQTLSEIVGYSISELLERNIHDLTAVKYRLSQKNKLRQLILGRSNSFSIEKYYICKNGSICWVNAIISLVSDSQGSPKNLIYIVEDITERKKAKIQLEQAKEKAEAANQAKSQFLANMSHELRTPLNAILGFTQLMTRSVNLSETHQEYLHIINRSGEHLLSLINEILDLSKIEAGQLETNQESFNLFHLLDDLQQMFSLKASAKDLELHFVKNSDVPEYIKSDQKKLRSVLINLLGNAIKFTEVGEISILIKKEEISPENASEMPKYRLIFTIQDTGVGIPPEDIDILFDAFVQSQSGKKQAEGTGLGLAISKHFVEIMGGNISVKSTLGVGSIFTFDIICDYANASDIGTISPQYHIIGLDLKPEENPPSILIIEDQWTNCELLLNILQPLGFEIQTAENGEKGLQIWENWHPDLILMDIRMPIMDGYEATKEIRSREKLRRQEDNADFPAVPIIALTASVFDSQKELLLSIGCDDFLAKPLDENKLLEKIGLYLNIKYLYQEIKPDLSEIKRSDQIKSKITADDLAIMPQEWRQELKTVALSARSKQILVLIDQIPLEYGYLKHSLIDLLNHLNYEKIAELTKENK